MTTLSQLKQFDLIGGVLCLDFCNTADGDVNQEWTEGLTSYADLAAWGYQTGTLDEAQTQRLLKLAAADPRAAVDALGRAVIARWTIYRLFSAVAAGHEPSSADLDAFNTLLAETLACLRVRPADNHFHWSWADDSDPFDRIRQEVLWSAARLLTSDQVHLVRECGGSMCSWLFLDTSRNHSRRWCDMKGCGNRAKARRHYQRTKAAT